MKDSKNLLLAIIVLLFMIIIIMFGSIIYLISQNSNNSDLENNQATSIDQQDEEIENENENIEPTVIPSVSEPVVEEDTTRSIKIFFFDQEAFINAEMNFIDYVNRTTERSDLATFAVEEIIKGPTTEEQTQGLAATFGDGSLIRFIGESNCGNKDFTISIEDRNATVRLCREIFINNDNSSGIMRSQIAQTINQFSSVDQTRVLRVSGECADDMAGLTPEECYL